MPPAKLRWYALAVGTGRSFSSPARSSGWPGYPDRIQRVQHVRPIGSRTCALRRRSGRSVMCPPAPPPDQMMSSVRAGRRRWAVPAPRITTAPSPGRTGAASGCSTAAPPPGFWPSSFSTPTPAATSRSAAPGIGGRARRPAPFSATPSPAANAAPRRPPAVSVSGSPGRSRANATNLKRSQLDPFVVTSEPRVGSSAARILDDAGTMAH